MFQHWSVRGAFVAIGLFVSSPSGGKVQLPASDPHAAAPVGSPDDVPNSVSKSDWSGIRAAYEAGRHAAYPVDGGYRARNPGQRWNTQFDGRGFLITPDDSGWTWGLELQNYGWGNATQIVAAAKAMNSVGQTTEYKWDERLTEWYKNDSRGVEHGYTVHSRPAHSNGTLILNLGVRGDLQAKIQNNCRDISFVNSSNVSVLNYSGLTVFDADGKQLPAQFESTNNALRLSVDENNARYPLTIDPIAQQAYLKASNTGVSDQFGVSVSASGNTVVVGSPFEDSSATGVDGDQSSNSATESGAAYVFVRTASTWTQQAYLKASNTGANDRFGSTVSVSGDTVVVGAHQEDSNATGVNGNQNDNSAIESGAAYVFVRTGSIWTQQAYLKASNTDAEDNFGSAVSISADTVVVSALGEDSNSPGVNGNQSDNSALGTGAAYVFVRSGTSWSQQAYLKASTLGADSFGRSISVSGDTIVIGPPGESSNATGVNGDESNNSAFLSGAAYVFVRTGTTWSQQAYLKASNTGELDFFGYAVAVSGDTIVAGAWRESSNAVGVNGNQSNNLQSLAGAAYVFFRSGTTWSQQAYLKASNTEAGDNFGTSVAVSGNTVVVGAPGEDSSANTINGNQNNFLALMSGAAYLFTRNGVNWSQQAYLKGSFNSANDIFGSSVTASGDVIVVGAPLEQSFALDAGGAYLFDVDNNPGTLSFGTGTPGCAGTHTLGVTHAPMINSPHFAITCDNAPPLSLGLGLVTDSQDLTGSDPFGLGVLLHSDFLFATEVLSFDFYSDGTGYAETVGTAIPNSAALIGKTYYASALWAWPTSTCVLPGFNPYNLSTSKGLAITILVP